MSKREFEGRKALVTGAGSGIGRALAVALGAGGAEVGLVGRREGALDETLGRIAEVGGHGWCLPWDLCAEEVPEGLASAVEGCDLLVNNAAAWCPRLPLEEQSEPDIERVVGTILLGSTRLARWALLGMKKRRRGSVLFIGSTAASQGAVGLAVYAAAKAGLGGLAKSVAAEAGAFGVRCNVLQPGLVRTERIEEVLDPDVERELCRGIALGRPGTMEEIVEVARFLLSERASYVTGATIEVSGGMGLGIYPIPRG